MTRLKWRSREEGKLKQNRNAVGYTHVIRVVMGHISGIHVQARNRIHRSIQLETNIKVHSGIYRARYTPVYTRTQQTPHGGSGVTVARWQLGWC